jgi:peptide/nickel transport system permease protein
MMFLVLRRVISTLTTLILVSMVTFVIIDLPPGDFADAYANKKISGGEKVTSADMEQIREDLGLNRPLYVQYLSWINGLVHGDFGFSWDHRRPVVDVIGERLPMTLLLAATTLFFDTVR